MRYIDGINSTIDMHTKILDGNQKPPFWPPNKKRPTGTVLADIMAW